MPDLREEDFKKAAEAIYGTGDSGTVTIQSDGASYRVRRER